MQYESSSSDITLVEGCLAGNEQAWEALISKYARLIYSTCRRFRLSQDEADDIFGRVSLLLLQNLQYLKDRSRLANWLITTTSRECWHYKKGQLQTQSYMPESDEAGILAEPTTAPLPEEEILRLERQQQLREALAQLQPRCRRLIHLLFYDPAEPPYAEIAKAMNIPVSSIGPTRARCLNKIREILAKEANEKDVFFYKSDNSLK